MCASVWGYLGVGSSVLPSQSKVSLVSVCVNFAWWNVYKSRLSSDNTGVTWHSHNYAPVFAFCWTPGVRLQAGHTYGSDKMRNDSAHQRCGCWQGIISGYRRWSHRRWLSAVSALCSPSLPAGCWALSRQLSADIMSLTRKALSRCWQISLLVFILCWCRSACV